MAFTEIFAQNKLYDVCNASVVNISISGMEKMVSFLFSMETCTIIIFSAQLRERPGEAFKLVRHSSAKKA